MCAFLFPRSEQLLHSVFLRRSVESRRAILLHDIENLVPKQIGLLLECLPHLNEGACNRTACRRMLADEPVLTHSFLALDETGEGLRVTFEESRIHQMLTAALLEPQPCFAENLVRAERLAVPLPRRQVLTRIRHICTEKLCSICKVCSVQFRHGEFHEPFFFCA